MKTCETLALTLQSKTKSFSQRALVISVYLFIFWVILPGTLYSVGFKMDKLMNLSLNIPVFAGWILFFSGALMMIVAMGQLKFQVKGLPISHLPPENCVDSGVYKYFRHPIYVGYTMSFAGISIIINSGMSLIFSTSLLLFGWIAYAYFYEEKVLLSRYGTAYEKYMKPTPILIPEKISSAFLFLIKPLTGKAFVILNKFANHTVLFRAGNVIFVTYGLYIAIGTALALSFTVSVLSGYFFTEDEILILIFGWGVSSALGGRIFWMLGHLQQIIREQLSGLRKVGFVSWGGITGLFIFSYIFSLFTGHQFLLISDIFLRGMFLVYAIGRLGCLSYGCCYGIKSQSNGIYYENPDAKALWENDNIKLLRHPVQFFSFLHGMVLFVILNVLAGMNLSHGLITSFALFLYPIGRGYIEFFRDRKKRFMNLLTDGHIGCIIMFVAGLIILHIIPETSNYNLISLWGLQSFINVVPVLPAILAISFLIIIFMGFHWKKVGQW